MWHSVVSTYLYGAFDCHFSLASMVYTFFDEKSAGNGIKNEFTQNQQLAEELHKPIIKKIKKRKVYSSSKDNM